MYFKKSLFDVDEMKNLTNTDWTKYRHQRLKRDSHFHQQLKSSIFFNVQSTTEYYSLQSVLIYCQSNSIHPLIHPSIEIASHSTTINTKMYTYRIYRVRGTPKHHPCSLQKCCAHIIELHIILFINFLFTKVQRSAFFFPFERKTVNSTISRWLLFYHIINMISFYVLHANY